MGHAVMFVCAANVCRSPLMAFTFANEVRETSRNDSWVINSRGVDVRRAAPICEVAAVWVTQDEAGTEFASAHQSTALDADELDDIDLILTASKAERSAIARMRPDARGRVFTVREAVALSNPMLPQPAGRRGDKTLAAFATMLNGRRGMMPVSRPPLKLPWVTTVDPLDIPDVHHENRKRHDAALKELRETVMTLHRNVDDFIQLAART